MRTITIYYIVSLCVHMVLAITLKQTSYEERTDCVDKSLIIGPITMETNVGSLMSCASQCLSSAGCLTFTYSTSTCRLHQGILDNSCGYHTVDIGARTFEKVCQNGGTPVNDTCICTGGYVGGNCERLATECGELLNYNYYPLTQQIVQIQPSLDFPPITIQCALDLLNPLSGKPRHYIQRHHKLGEAFYKLWNDYKNGFGDMSVNEYWLGNEAIHVITSSFPSLLVVEMASEGWSSIWQQEYKGFLVEDESTEYRMTYKASGPYPSNSGMGDSLIVVNNTMFCTEDHNNNVDPGTNCGNVRKSGFWFCDPGNKCGNGNPNGVLQQTANGEINYVFEEVFWLTLQSGLTSPWFVQMWLEV